MEAINETDVNRLAEKLSLHIIRESEPMVDSREAGDALNFLKALAGKIAPENLTGIFNGQIPVIHAEILKAWRSDRKDAFDVLERVLGSGDNRQIQDAIWTAFFPEALGINDNPQEKINQIRESRIVEIIKTRTEPISNPARQIMFTSNILLSPPIPEKTREANKDSDSDMEALMNVVLKVSEEEQQLYWYDHPIAIGTDKAKNEAIYGLRGLAKTLGYEKERGTINAKDRLSVLLSVSVTHAGLRQHARLWLKSQMDSLGLEAGMDIYAFTEKDAEALVEILSPWLANNEVKASLKETLGVDGEYGRHYSFLKAVPAMWSILANPELQGTFKIDLDQIFPQEKLIEETGRSAFEHFMTPLWGAIAKDGEGKELELGMLAGALVNESDISKGLFTPDIPWPEMDCRPEEKWFFKQMPMAASTRAELMCRYEEFPDGVNHALQRIHVTGGTTGIRLDALRRHRPFCPSFVGRAEDQAYILSILDSAPLKLRYLHASGLIMRHDKMAFANTAVKAGKMGAYVGDLQRIFIFSHYSSWLTGGQIGTKKLLDPFTGSYITPLPKTMVLMKLAMKLVSSHTTDSERIELTNLVNQRLGIYFSSDMEKQLRKVWLKERDAWASYYNALDNIERDITNNTESAERAKMQFNKLLESTKIN